jgi:two-component system, chemotaxis family, chemotaxis protein CheY
MVARRSDEDDSISDAGTLLVVDDDSDVRDAMRDVISDYGYRVVCARDGEEALRYLRSNPPPTAILLDLFMPRMNGWQLARELESSPRLAKIPVITVTASAPHWGYPVPMARVVRKPFDVEHLVRVIGKVTATVPARPSRA